MASQGKGRGNDASQRITNLEPGYDAGNCSDYGEETKQPQKNHWGDQDEDQYAPNK